MGKLYVVPTPVGNLEDITLRAIRTLKTVDLIIAEDTRTSSILLKHLDIHKPMMPHHKFNEHQTSDKVIKLLKEGKDIALISDAGTPAISDPGFFIVRECVKNDIEVTTLPGPTAFVPAIVNAALPNDRFCFEGFLPLKKGRNSRLNELAEEKRTMIFYEAPFRVIKTLQQFISFFGEDRNAAVCREISKLHEECIRGTIAQLLQHFTIVEPKGECVIIVEGMEESMKKEQNASKNKYKV